MNAVQIKLTSLVISGIILSGCGGGGDSVQDINTQIDKSNSSSSCNGRYADLVTASARSAAKNDTQCSSYVAYADSYLQATKAACAQGEMAKADSYYQSTYRQAASYANTSVASVCGSGSGSGSGSGNNAYISLFIQRTNGGTITAGRCTNGSQPSDDNLHTWYSAGSYSSMADCNTAAKRYGLS